MPVSKFTENTVTRIVANELEKRGIKAHTFVNVRIPGVGRREVDILCKNAGTYVIEAKFLEREWLDAISKIYHDYLVDPSIEGGFAILYPSELSSKFPQENLSDLLNKLKFKVLPVLRPQDKRGFRLFSGTIYEIADTLSQFILKPPEYFEPSIPDIINSLRDIANRITETLKHLTGAELEDLFGGKDVFRNILQYEEHKYPIEDLRLAAAYILVSQLLFYHVLSRSKPDLFPELNPQQIKYPTDLKRMYFDKVLDINYRAVLAYDIASKISKKHMPQIKAMITAIKAIAPEKVRGDLLGTIFHDLIPLETRKSVAAYYTNVLAAELLAWLAIEDYRAKVADFAVGSGGLLVASYRRKRFLIEQFRKFTQEDHRKFVEEDLLGIDVMPFAAHVAACHLALQAPEYPTNKVKIAIWDSTELKPGVRIPPIASLGFVLSGQSTLDAYISESPKVKGVVSLKDEISEEIPLEYFDVIIMNPPFTRQERLPQNYKKVLIERFSDYKDYLHGQLGYYGYFIFLADRFLRNGGTLALVLPATVLRIQSCEGIRKLLTKKYKLEYIITTWYRSAFSESVRFREILLVAKKEKPENNFYTKIVILKKLPSTIEESRKLAEIIKISQEDFENNYLIIKNRKYYDFISDTKNWFKYISVSNLDLIDLLEQILNSDKLINFSKLYSVKESDFRHYKFKNFSGFIIYNKSRAQKKEDIWISEGIKDGNLVVKHKILNYKIKIPLNVLVKSLRRNSYVDKLDVTNISDYLIVKWFDQIKNMASFVLPENEIQNFDESVVNQWYNNYEKRKSHVLLARRFDLSAPGTRLLAFYSEVPIVGVDMWTVQNIDKDDAKILSIWFNSTLNILQLFINRTETRGAWMKIHDYMLNEFKIPNICSFNKKERKLLINTFDEIRNYKFDSILKQLETSDPYRIKMDKIWLRILNYKENIDVFIENLYKSLAKEIRLLKELMKEKSLESTYLNIIYK